jgi:hypothetical protein
MCVCVCVCVCVLKMYFKAPVLSLAKIIELVIDLKLSSLLIFLV